MSYRYIQGTVGERIIYLLHRTKVKWCKTIYTHKFGTTNTKYKPYQLMRENKKEREESGKTN